MITALANNELEVANLAFSTLPIAILNAGLSDLRVIADELQDGVAGYYSQEYMVLTDGPIKKVEDLKGKVVGTVAPGAAVDVAIRSMLRKHGLEDKRDYVMLEAPLPTMRAMLAENKVGPGAGRAALCASIPNYGASRTPLFVNRDVVGVTQLLLVVRTAILHRQEPRRHGRLHGGYAAHHALVPRPDEPQGGGRDRRPPDQAAAGTLRLAVHREGLLPRART